MKTLKIFVSSLFFILVTPTQTWAQDEECASDIVQKHLLETDSNYFNRYQILENEVANIINNQRSRLNPNVVYTIPVVVHVFHLGEPIGTGTNISDAQIIGAIDGLNLRWSNDFEGANIQIQFCLASRDPNGNPTTGINRINGSSIPNYATKGLNIYSTCDGAGEVPTKDLTRWPVNNYYNIWVVYKLCPGGANGFAYYPNGNPYDGATIKYSVFNYDSSVLAHEMGHGFNLYHTFEGDGGNVSCPLDSACASNGDFVCDTPPHKQRDCGESNPCSATGVWSNSVNNYMSYCSNKYKFTQGQKDRIRASAIVNPRLSLLSSLGCSALGINNNDLGKFTIFPNPTHEKIILQFTDTIISGKIQIFNIIGKKIIEQDITNSTIEINVEPLLKGVYLVKFYNSDIAATHKLIVD